MRNGNELEGDSRRKDTTSWMILLGAHSMSHSLPITAASVWSFSPQAVGRGQVPWRHGTHTHTHTHPGLLEGSGSGSMPTVEGLDGMKTSATPTKSE